MLSTSGKLCIETNSDAEGIFSAYIKNKTLKRLRLRVVKGSSLLTYSLRSDGKAETFPLQLGDGRYEITLCENTSGKEYAKCGTVYLFIKMGDKTAPFLHANQYVNYTEDSDLVAKARELCFGKSQKIAYDSVCQYIKTSFAYDYIKSATVKNGALPNIDTTFIKHMGICQDLAALTVAMLRSQGIPSKLVIGYINKQYHAWTESLIDGKKVIFDPTAEINGIGKVRNYKIERCY